MRPPKFFDILRIYCVSVATRAAGVYFFDKIARFSIIGGKTGS